VTGAFLDYAVALTPGAFCAVGIVLVVATGGVLVFAG